jgi:hypothetical protein
MNTFKLKNLQVLHLTLGIFFSISGILTLFKANYLFSIWIISLGLFFLSDIFGTLLVSGIKPVLLKTIHYTFAIIVLLTGILTIYFDAVQI